MSTLSEEVAPIVSVIENSEKKIVDSFVLPKDSVDFSNAFFEKTTVLKITASGTNITSFATCPRDVLYLDVSNTNIKSFKDCPTVRSLDITGCNFTSFEDCPQSVLFLFADNCKFTKFEGISEQLQCLSIRNNPINLLTSLPHLLVVLRMSGCPITDFTGLSRQIRYLEYTPRGQVKELYTGIAETWKKTYNEAFALEKAYYELFKTGEAVTEYTSFPVDSLIANLGSSIELIESPPTGVPEIDKENSEMNKFITEKIRAIGKFQNLWREKMFRESIPGNPHYEKFVNRMAVVNSAVPWKTGPVSLTK